MSLDTIKAELMLEVEAGRMDAEEAWERYQDAVVRQAEDDFESYMAETAGKRG